MEQPSRLQSRASQRKLDSEEGSQNQKTSRPGTGNTARSGKQQDAGMRISHNQMADFAKSVGDEHSEGGNDDDTVGELD